MSEVDQFQQGCRDLGPRMQALIPYGAQAEAARRAFFDNGRQPPMLPGAFLYTVAMIASGHQVQAATTVTMTLARIPTVTTLLTMAWETGYAQALRDQEG